MFEFHNQSHEPVAISAFGSQSRLALSPDIQAGSSREVAARGPVITTQVVRRSQLQSTFSGDGFFEVDTASRQAVVEHFVNPQLRSLSATSPPEHLVSAAVMLLAMGQPQQAFDFLSKVSDSGHYWTGHYRAICLWKLQRADEAKALLRDLMSQSPSDARPAHALGRLLLLENKNDEAWMVFQELIGASKNPDLLTDAASAAIQLNRLREAITLLRRALKVDSQHPLGARRSDRRG